MLRFRSNIAVGAARSGRPLGAASRQRWRVWILLVALGVVIATMRQLNSPDTAQRLEQLFGAAADGTPQEPSDLFVTSTPAPADRPSHVAVAAQGVSSSINDDNRASDSANAQRKMGTEIGITDALAQVQDNTYFRPAETAAWFELFGRLLAVNGEQLREASLGELTYAQLLQQPDRYRGQVVTIRGTVRRQEIESPAENSLGIEFYHRLVMQPRGGGHWPFVVYCLDLPDGFPRGDDLEAVTTVTGCFFKNWSYAWQNGLGLAPVVLARRIEWQPARVWQPRARVTSGGMTLAFVAAGGFALFVVLWVVRSTRRPANSSPRQELTIGLDQVVVETLEQRLQRLAESEAHE